MSLTIPAHRRLRLTFGDMKMKLPIAYRRPIVLGMWGFYALSITVAFFSLPTPASVLLAVFGAILPVLCTTICYTSRVMWVMPIWSERSDSNRLGVIWFKKSYQGKERTGLGLLFEDRDCAKEVFIVLRAWNFGNFIDDDGNISLSIIREGNHRYTFFLYPGMREFAERQIRAEVESREAGTHEAQVFRLFQWTCMSITCDDHPEKEEAIESLGTGQVVLLNCYHATRNGVEAYSKRPLVLKRLRLCDRALVPARSLEAMQKWEDLPAIQPRTVARVGELWKKVGAESSKGAERGHTSFSPGGQGGGDEAND